MVVRLRLSSMFGSRVRVKEIRQQTNNLSLTQTYYLALTLARLLRNGNR